MKHTAVEWLYTIGRNVSRSYHWSFAGCSKPRVNPTSVDPAIPGETLFLWPLLFDLFTLHRPHQERKRFSSSLRLIEIEDV